jgi:saccharopine dehydrogenase-like NADP-dependent oxidoreductase
MQRVKADVVVNACDPRMNDPIFNAAFTAGCGYIDMAMNLSLPHPTNPYEEVGVTLGRDQLSSDEKWRERGILALVGMGVEPGLSDIFARYAADHLFDTIDEIGVRDGSNLSIDGLDFAPTFSIWTTIVSASLRYFTFPQALAQWNASTWSTKKFCSSHAKLTAIASRSNTVLALNSLTG